MANSKRACGEPDVTDAEAERFGGRPVARRGYRPKSSP